MGLEEPEGRSPTTHWQCGPQRPPDVGPQPAAGPPLPKPVPCNMHFATGSGEARWSEHCAPRVAPRTDGECRRAPVPHMKPLNMYMSGSQPSQPADTACLSSHSHPRVQGPAHLSPADQCSRNFFLPSPALPEDAQRIWGLNLTSTSGTSWARAGCLPELPVRLGSSQAPPLLNLLLQRHPSYLQAEG